MLSMNAIQSLEYYSDLANEDYYIAGGEPDGQWAGKGAFLLGLKGTIEIEEYKNVMRGYAPSGKASLCARPGDNHRPGWDLTFSATKSATVIWARSNEKDKLRIQNIHKNAVLAALKHLEEHAAITRLGTNGIFREATVGLVASLFEHSTSRAQDPQLHTHCLIANVAPRHDGSWGTIESRDLYLWQRSAGAIYRAEFAYQLKEMGFSIEADRDAFHIKGVPKSLCEYYSKRAHQIREQLVKYGRAKSASKIGDIIALNTREKKSSIDRATLYEKWKKEMDEKGFTESKLKQILESNEKRQDILWDDSESSSLITCDTKTVLERLTEKMSVFRAQDAYRIAAELAQWSGDNANTAQQVAEAILKDKESISLGLDTRYNQLYTTSYILTAEKQMIDAAKKLREQSGFNIPMSEVDTAIKIKNFSLSDEQKEAVKPVCQEHRFAILQGSAGAGKSASMDCVREAYENQGYKVIGAAIAKSAADNLAKEGNIRTFTVAKLLIDIDRGRAPLAEKTVLLVDEAGQVGTRDLAKLLTAAQSRGCKIVLVGEDKQLDAIEHGGSLRYLSQPEILGTTRIETIRRQREKWAREAVANFRDGNALHALQEHKKRGLLHFCKDSINSKECLVEQWDFFRKNNPSKKSLILAQRWSDVTDLNAILRKILQKEGKVCANGFEVDCAVSDKHIKYTIAVGERVKFTKNDYRRGYTNGDLGTVVGIEKLADGDLQFDIETDAGGKVHFKASEYCNEYGNVYLTQAYALTVYASQGLTVDGDVFVFYNSGMDRSNTYVAGSRHKDNCHWFVNNKEIDELASIDNKSLKEDEKRLKILAKLMASENRKKLAIEYLKNEQPVVEKSHSKEALLSL